MHYRSCGSQSRTTDWCPCGQVDASTRLSGECQVEAAFEAETYVWRSYDYDPGSDWYTYLRSRGWSEEQIYGVDLPPADRFA